MQRLLLATLLTAMLPALVAAQVPVPIDMRTLGGTTLSVSNPMPSCIVGFGGSQCITIPDAVVDDFDTDMGDTSNIELFGLALPSATGPVRVDANTPLPVITTTFSSITVLGPAAHDSPVTGAPLTMGLTAIAHGTNPGAVTAGDSTRWYSNRGGVPFVIGGHPNVFSIEAQVQDADGAQTDVALVTCGTGCKVVVTFAKATCDPDNTGDIGIRVGFGTASVPAGAHTGTNGVVLANDGIAPGGGEVSGTGGGIIGTGADGEDLRYTSEDPAGGSCNVIVKGYTIDS